MLSAHNCGACMASLLVEDGHDQCPPCLGVGHLREAVSDNPCMNCCFMHHALRLGRLAEVEGGPGLPPSGVGPSSRLASILQAYDVHLCLIPGRGPLWYPVPIALNHVQVDNRGASASQHKCTSAVALRYRQHLRHQEVRCPPRPQGGRVPTPTPPPGAPRGREG